MLVGRWFEQCQSKSGCCHRFGIGIAHVRYSHRYHCTCVCCYLTSMRSNNTHSSNNCTCNNKKCSTSEPVASATRGGPDPGQLFCTTCAQIALVLCEPLQAVALKRCADCTASPSVRGETVQAVWTRQQAFAASCAACSSLLCCEIWILRCTAVLATNLGLSGYPSLSFEASTNHKYGLCLHLCFAVTVAYCDNTQLAL